jgi:hypothetical protein
MASQALGSCGGDGSSGFVGVVTETSTDSKGNVTTKASLNVFVNNGQKNNSAQAYLNVKDDEGKVSGKDSTSVATGTTMVLPAASGAGEFGASLTSATRFLAQFVVRTLSIAAGALIPANEVGPHVGELPAEMMAVSIAAHEKEQAIAISRARTADGGIVLYHGTDVQSALRLLNGEPLSAQIANGNKIDGPPGFYLATDYDDAAFFATRRGEGAVIQFIISNKALGGLNANGAYFQKIPVGGFRADGYEYLVPPQAFEAFNSYRKTEDIVATP